MNGRRIPSVLALGALLLAPGCSCASKAPPEPPAVQPPLAEPRSEPTRKSVENGRLYEVAGFRVLELSGTPEQMGTAHGKLLGAEVRRVLRDVLRPGADPRRYKRIVAGARVMEEHQPERFRREMKSLAGAAGAQYIDVVALQLFGDAERGEVPGKRGGATEAGYQCTSFALFGPATRGGELICGRNFDYWYSDVAGYAALVIHYKPEEGRGFVTLSWSGVINGWTLMNDAGLVAANNNAWGRDESLKGISTCFLQRLIAERASTVREAVAIARKGPRAVGTAMLVAAVKDGPDAAELEFDHKGFAVRRARKGWVLAANGCRKLGCEQPPGPEEDAWGRYGKLLELVRKHYGKIDRSMNMAAEPGVPLEGINLQCVTLFPGDLTLRVAMGRAPACKGPFKTLRVTEKGLVEVK